MNNSERLEECTIIISIETILGTNALAIPLH